MMELNYETLRVIWWLLLGILLIGFAIMDGLDIGVAMLLPIVSRDDDSRRIVINTVGPVWEGNQVWIILGAGAIFAAWPTLYAVSFSGLYLAMMLLLSTFILRPVCFKYRSKMPSTLWRNTFDSILSGAGFVAALVFGVAVGNALQGLPFSFDSDMRMTYTGTFLELFTPFTLLCGVMSILMMMMQGGTYLAVKTEGDIRRRTITMTRLAGVLLPVLFVVAGYYVVNKMEGYELISPMIHDGPSNPTLKSASKLIGAWVSNFIDHPILILAPIVGIAGALFAALLVSHDNKLGKIGVVASSLSIAGVIGTVGLSMFPFILPSSTHPDMSLMVWDASSSRLTLLIMLVSVIIFLPIILAYTAWVYRVLRGKITLNFLRVHDKDMY